MLSRLVKKTSLILMFILGMMVVGESTVRADESQTGKPSLFTPMSDTAAQGMGCLVTTTSSLALAYTIGPTELMMLVTGAVIVPSKSSLLFITLAGILGAGTCGVGAALTPSILWAKENSTGISERITDGLKTSLKPKIEVGKIDALENHTIKVSELRPMNEDEIQGIGCLVGLLGLGSIALATAPTEAVMLAAGGVGVPSNTPLLMMGMLGTLLPAGCSMGAAASLPLTALYRNFDSAAIGQKLAAMMGWKSADNVRHEAGTPLHKTQNFLLPGADATFDIAHAP